MDFTLDLMTARGYTESWGFHWVLSGWEIRTVKETFLTGPDGRDRDPDPRQCWTALYRSLLGAGVPYPSTFPDYLQRLWERLSVDPECNVTEPAKQLETWIEVIRREHPRDPAFHDPII